MTLKSWQPALTNPTTINVPTTGGTFTIPATQDYRLILPRDKPVTNRIQVNGGRHCHLIGGKFTGASHTGLSGSAAVALNFNDVGGPSPAIRPVIYLEGVLFDYSQKTDQDLIWVGGWNSSTDRAKWSRPNLVMQNCHLRGANWSGGSQHPDCFQKNAPLGGIKLYQCTFEAVYQALFIPTQEGPDGSVGGGWRQGGADNYIERCNFRVRNNTRAAYLLWLNWDRNTGTSQEWPPVPMPRTVLGPDVWVDGKPGDTLKANLVWPRYDTVGVNGDQARDVRLIASADGLSATWKAGALIDGTIHKGVPGDFCTAAMCGLNYDPKGT